MGSAKSNSWLFVDFSKVTLQRLWVHVITFYWKRGGARLTRISTTKLIKKL